MEKEIVLAHLERAREDWLPHYQQARRAANMNAELNLSAEYAFVPIDALLDELLGHLAVSQIVESQG